MTTSLLIEIDRNEGSLQRLIGLIERRGFDIQRMTLSDNGANRRVELAVLGRDESRHADILCRQIDRLIGVRRLAPNLASTVGFEAAPCPA